MNPRYRRLLIPGLLAVLIAVVLISALARSARGVTTVPQVSPEGIVNARSDPPITESSGLVLSLTRADPAYTISDSGNDPVVFAIRVSTGKVVGTTRVIGSDLFDTEALSIDDKGNLRVAAGALFLRRRR